MLSQKQGKNNISFYEGFFFPFNAINTHWRDFVLLTGLFSLISSVMVLLTGQCYLCFSSLEISEQIFCSEAWWNVLIYYVSIFLLLALFISRWQVIFAENKSFEDVIKKRMFRQDKKAMLFVFIFFLLCLVIDESIILLHERQVSPNWLTELGFFIVVSLMIVFSATLLFNFVIFQHFLQGGRFFELNKTFWPVLDNIYKYMIWFLLYFVMFSFLFMMVQVISWGNMFLLGRLFIMEFCIYFLVYTVAAFFIASLNYQEKIFFDKK